MKFNTRYFYWIALFNLSIVAFFGLIMRYKIGFEFPYLNQKHILHAHSHFAFAGWVTHALYTFLTDFLQKKKEEIDVFKKLIWANLLVAFGMLISFLWQGYGPVSIILSTLSIFIGYSFTWFFWKRTRFIKSKEPAVKWFLAALLFQTLSSIGTFYLAWMMATSHFDQSFYLGSIYFYLHFQYSGWFFFAIMGLLIFFLQTNPDFSDDKKFFSFFVIACVPAFFLSVLWANLPWYLYGMTLLAVIFQLAGLYYFLVWLIKQENYMRRSMSFIGKILLLCSLFALVIKLLLQAGSVFPEISQLAFGYRSIVIAYLHLVLLGMTTLFFLGYGSLNGWLRSNRLTTTLLLIFCCAVFVNELVLMIQGLAGFFYVLVPWLNEILLFVSLVLFSSISLLVFKQK